VKTAGTRAKFGISVDETGDVAALVRAAGARVVGLHSHAGSGVFDTNNWSQVGRVLAGLLTTFPDVRAVDVGGGLGVPDRIDAAPLDLSQLATALAGVKAALGGRELWLEPGRYLVAQAGVLLAKVTQVKHKGTERFVGLTTGMNSLLRPALYGAHHDIINLTRSDAESDEPAHVVGPICESADFLGHDRLLPDTREGDVMLIATAGAYGHVMGSNYNHRAPAEELIL
jgi:bifunctional diaminopimelate decarboxylase / aspartate kinase